MHLVNGRVTKGDPEIVGTHVFSFFYSFRICLYVGLVCSAHILVLFGYFSLYFGFIDACILGFWFVLVYFGLLLFVFFEVFAQKIKLLTFPLIQSGRHPDAQILFIWSINRDC